jgi:acetyltransferase-like isoleucine patch superfamily enzyme
MIYRLIHRIILKAEREAFMHKLRALNKAGHDFSMEVQYGRRLEIHAAESSKVVIGSGSEILHDCWIIAHPGDQLCIHENVFVSQHCTISGDVEIGKDTLIAGFVTILDSNHNYESNDKPVREQGGMKAAISIGEDVWIGASSVILPGVKIGNHSIIGANSTVTEDIPDWSIAVGSPARVIKDRRAKS